MSSPSLIKICKIPFSKLAACAAERIPLTRAGRQYAVEQHAHHVPFPTISASSRMPFFHYRHSKQLLSKQSNGKPKACTNLDCPALSQAPSDIIIIIIIYYYYYRPAGPSPSCCMRCWTDRCTTSPRSCATPRCEDFHLYCRCGGSGSADAVDECW